MLYMYLFKSTRLVFLVLTNITLQVQKAHKRSDQYSNEDDNGGDTFESLSNSITKSKDTGVKKKFRVNGHRVDFLQNIQHQVCFRKRISFANTLNIIHCFPFFMLPQIILSNLYLRFTMTIIHKRALTWC